MRQKIAVFSSLEGSEKTKSQLCELILNPKIVNINPFNVGKKGHSSKKRNLPPDEIKKRIMIALFRERKGLNQNKIYAITTLNSADWNFLGAILAELCFVGKLNAEPTDSYKEGQWVFSLTDEGRKFITLLKEIKGLGAGFTFFEKDD